MKKLLIYQNKKKFDEYLKEKKEWNYLKYMEKMDYIGRLRRKDENLRQLKYEKLKDKQSRREKIKFDRMDVYDTKQLKMYYLDNERKRNIIKIKNILDTGIDEENLDKILRAFPGNREIDKVIENYKNQKEIIQNRETTKSYNFYKRPKSQGKLMIKSFNKKNNRLKINENKKNADLRIPNVLSNTKSVRRDNSNNKNNKNKIVTEDNKKDIIIYYESEIRDKIKQYKENIYREFFKHVEDEKKNEDLRNKELENVHDPIKKHELEKRFSKERALVDLRLRRENQNIEEKIRNYEIRLRKNNINNHNQSILYRKMYLMPEDFNIYLNSIGEVICYPSFTSTSLVETWFSPNPSNKDEQLVELIIEQNNSKSVVSISEISQSPKEKEYLFLPFSFFKIKDVKIDKGIKGHPHIINLIALTSEKPIEEMILDYMENETDNLDPEGIEMLNLCDENTRIIINPNLFINNRKNKQSNSLNY